MTLAQLVSPKQEIIYPESDGKPMADNTKQFRYIVTIECGLDAQFAKDPNVFVAGDFFWYPVEGHPEIRVAPDALVVFGRPKGDRGSYLQWKEENIAPQVVFEILSPSNTPVEMARKNNFYARYGVEEYYEYDPDRGELRGWLRSDHYLEPIEEMAGWISPRLQVRFELEDGELVLFHPDGTRFETFVEISERAEREAERAERERAEREGAQARAERLAAKLRALGIEPEEGEPDA